MIGLLTRKSLDVNIFFLYKNLVINKVNLIGNKLMNNIF